MTRTVLIAETDVNGAIAWVWRFGPHDRIAHPLDETSACLDALADFDVSGASKEAVLGWLKAMADKTGGVRSLRT
jgi:hypothetical protein